jgi:alanyl-tRNA synthetase
MEKTIRQFYDESTQTRFTAVVQSCVPSDPPGYAAVLDRTLFYPEGGGQPADTGFIGEARVLDVKERGGVIYHYLDKPLEPGSTVSGEIDWERRLAFMRNHTGEHIVSGILNSHYGLSNVGFHMGSDFVTIDTTAPISKEDLANVEILANKAVCANERVLTEFPGTDSLKTMDFRSKLPEEALKGGDVRIVRIPGYDACACCGLHCGSTGEVGVIKLVVSQKYKAGTRIYMLCGEDAVKDYAEKNDSVYGISGLLSAKPSEVLPAVRSLLAEKAALEQVIAGYKNRLFTSAAESVVEGSPYHCHFEEGLSPDDMKRLAALLAERANIGAVFSGTEGAYKYAIYSKYGVAETAEALHAAFGGKGGVREFLAQGSISGMASAIKDFFMIYTIN